MEKKNIFRQESLDRINSPEQMNDYIRVTNPGVFMVLMVIVLLMLAVCAWGVFGRLETTVSGIVDCKDGVAKLYIRESDSEAVRAGMKVRLDSGETARIRSVSSRLVSVQDGMDAYSLHVSKWGDDEWVLEAELYGNVPEGVSACRVVVDSVKPMSFIIN